MTKPPSPRPLSIKVISGVYLFGSVAAFLSLHHTASLFGLVISGRTAFLQNRILALLLLGLAIGLWRLHETARRISILYECYNLLETWVLMPLFFNPQSSSSVIRDFIVKDLPQGASGNPTSMRLVLMIGAVCGFAMCIITPTIIWFLVKRKSAFVKVTD